MDKQRNSVLDLWRFIAGIIILLLHRVQLWDESVWNNLSWKEHFSIGWIWVEFYFIITGYFTMKHFINKSESTFDGKVRSSIIYTLGKFSVFIPYTVITVFVTCMVRIICRDLGVSTIFESVFEMFLIFPGYKNDGALWFLSAMLMVFPLFCFICQSKSRYFIYILAFWINVIYVYEMGINSFCAYPQSWVRAITFLLLGALVYYFVYILKQMTFTKGQRILLTIIEQGSLLFAVFVTYISKYIQEVIVMCFVIGLTIMLSEQSYTSRIKVKFFSFLGNISLVMYIIQLPIAKLIYSCNWNKNVMATQILFFGGTFIVSVILYLLVEKVKKKINFNTLRYIYVRH